MKSFTFKIISSDGKLYTEKVEELIVETTEGTIGILAGHASLVAELTISLLKVKNGDTTNVFAITGGFLSVNKNVATIVTEAFENSKDIDESRALDAKTKAEQLIKSLDFKKDSDEMKIAQMALNRAINRLNAIK